RLPMARSGRARRGHAWFPLVVEPDPLLPVNVSATRRDCHRFRAGVRYPARRRVGSGGPAGPSAGQLAQSVAVRAPSEAFSAVSLAERPCSHSTSPRSELATRARMNTRSEARLRYSAARGFMLSAYTSRAAHA